MKSEIKNRAGIIFLVIGTYLFFSLPHLANCAFSKKPHEPYTYLTEGFLTGHLHLSISPPKDFLHLAHPYNPKENYQFRNSSEIRLHDMSFYQGQLYLYFSPLPVITFFMPLKLLTHYYLPEVLAVWFFLSLGFLAEFFLLIKIKNNYFPIISEKIVLFSGAIIGFTNNASFLLSRPLMYEVAISSAFCSMMIALFFLYEFINKKKARHLFLFSIFLSFSVASRPHFILACIGLVPLLLIYFIKHNKKNNLAKYIFSLIIPLLFMSFFLLLYNFLRFHSIFEFGQNYMLSAIDAEGIGLYYRTKIVGNILHGFISYFLRPATINLTFPFIHYYFLGFYIKNYYVDPTIGIFFSAPILFFIFFLPYFIGCSFKKKNQAFYELNYFLLFVLIISIIIALFIITLSGVTQRYESDFSPYFIMLSIISFWMIEQSMQKKFLFLFFKCLFILGGIFSIFVGLNLGLAAFGSSFVYYTLGHSQIGFNPILFLYLSLIPILIKVGLQIGSRSN